MTEYHFFVTTQFEWRVGDSLFETLERLPIYSEGEAVEIWQVPGSKEADYAIVHFAPQVEGAVRLYTGRQGKQAGSCE